MVVYGCKRCGYSTNNKSYIRKHLLRKHPCTIVLSDISVNELYKEIFGENIPERKTVSKNQKNTDKKTQNVSMLQKNGAFCVSMSKVTNKPPESYINNSLRNSEARVIMRKKHADGTKKNVKKSQYYNSPNTPQEIGKNRRKYKKQLSGIMQSKMDYSKNQNVSMNKKIKKQHKYLESMSDDECCSGTMMLKSHADAKVRKSLNRKVAGRYSRKKYYKKTKDGQIVETVQMKVIPNNNYNNEIYDDNNGNMCSNYGDNVISLSESDDGEEIYNKGYLNNSGDEANSEYDHLNKSCTDDVYEIVSEEDILSNNEAGDVYECCYCAKPFMHRQSRHRHEKTCKSQQNLQNKCDQLELKLEKRDEDIEHLKVQLEKILDRAVGEVHNHNTTNYTYNIMLNAFGQENSTYINGNHMNKILKQGVLTSIPRILELLHFNPEHEENHNVQIPNRKENIAKVFNGKEWILRTKNTTIDEMTNKAYNLLNAHYETGESKHVDEFNQKYEEGDKSIKKRVHKDTELMIINHTNNSSNNNSNIISADRSSNTKETISVNAIKNGNIIKTNSINMAPSKIILHNK
tara:strand:+ start:3553 stop:5274 length:1722 start_codon:yes stop_codon:yes gene_type:complete